MKTAEAIVAERHAEYLTIDEEIEKAKLNLEISQAAVCGSCVGAVGGLSVGVITYFVLNIVKSAMSK